ncbi:MAG: hypothetical protein ACXVZI_12975, partial [Terriglobales bacterium]
MRHFVILVLIAVISTLAMGQRAAERRGTPPAERATEAPADAEETKPPVADKEKDKEKEPPEEKPVVTHHQITVGGKALRYTATVGTMPIKNEQT